MIVCKFGGGCTTSAEAIKNIKRISKNTNRRVFVFSAIGKHFDGDQKLTDLLISYFNSREKDILNEIKLKVEKLCKLTCQRVSVKSFLSGLKKTKDYDTMLSRGEYFTTKIMSKYLDIKFVPAEKIIFFEEGEINYTRVKKRLNFYLKKYQKFGICGFYGVDLEGNIKLFSRGGGDTTGAIIAKAVDADVYENYTDVDGLKEADPKVHPNAKTIKRISYQKMKELSLNGANVLHKSVCEILHGSGIFTKIININNINGDKTTIF